MKILKLFITVSTTIGLTACEQTIIQKMETIQKNNTMDTSKLTNKIVKIAIDTRQSDDSKTFT